MNSIIEPVAKRLFDAYYRYCRQSGLEDLQYVTEESYKLHERLCKQPGNKAGLFGLDEFLLLKALRNYSVHQDEFIGKAFAIKPSLAEELRLDLPKVCLVEKATVKKAINYEPRLLSDSDEQKKVQRIKGQLVDFGESYNLEPVIYNFIVKVYELLVGLNLSIPGEGFKELNTAYKKEEYYRYNHYVPLNPVGVDHTLLLSNLMSLEKRLEQKEELLEPEQDAWYSIGGLNVDCSTLELMTYSEGEYEIISETVLSALLRDEHPYKTAMSVPNHIGIALITDAGELNIFNINQQKALLEKSGIEIDEVFFDLAPNELLVLLIVDGNKLFPVVLSKQDLYVAYRPINTNNSAVNKSNVDTSISTVEKRKKKSKRKQAAKARKAQRK